MSDRFATVALLSDVRPQLVRYYAIVLAGRCCCWGCSPARWSTAASVRRYAGLPAWAVIPFQLLSMVGVALIGRDLRASASGQLRFGAYAGAVVPLLPGAILVQAPSHAGRFVAVAIVAALCLAWVIWCDAAAGRAGRRP